mgnify:CR=1 FL=1
MKTQEGASGLDEMIFLFFNDVGTTKRPHLTGTLKLDGEKKRVALWKKSEKKYAGRIENPDRSTFVRAELFKCKSSEQKAIFKLLHGNSESEHACYLVQLVTKNDKTYYRGMNKPMPQKNN